jgi:hypothetical protein
VNQPAGFLCDRFHFREAEGRLNQAAFAFCRKRLEAGTANLAPRETQPDRARSRLTPIDHLAIGVMWR